MKKGYGRKIELIVVAAIILSCGGILWWPFMNAEVKPWEQGEDVPKTPPAEDRRVCNPHHFSIVAPPRWEWRVMPPEPDASYAYPTMRLWPKKSFPRRCASIYIVKLGEMPSVLADCGRTSFQGQPADPSSQVIPTVRQLDASILELVRDRATGLSRGGMARKLEAARQVTAAGGNVIIAGGRTPGVLAKILAGEPVGTLVLAQGPLVTARKRWIGFAVQPRGRLVVDAGARRAVQRQGRSLLPIGIVKVTGSFKKGDVVALCDSDGSEFARGLTNYGSDDIRRIRGLRTGEIAEALGHCPYDEVIHRDNMVVTT